MLKIWFGENENECYNTKVLFDNSYEDSWITSDFAKEVIADIDKSRVISANVIVHDYYGAYTPEDLSGGTKTVLLCMYDDNDFFYNTSSRYGI